MGELSRARAREPNDAAVEPAVQVAAAPVLGDEGYEGGEEVWHGEDGTESLRARPVCSG